MITDGDASSDEDTESGEPAEEAVEQSTEGQSRQKSRLRNRLILRLLILPATDSEVEASGKKSAFRSDRPAKGYEGVEEEDPVLDNAVSLNSPFSNRQVAWGDVDERSQAAEPSPWQRTDGSDDTAAE